MTENSTSLEPFVIAVPGEDPAPPAPAFPHSPLHKKAVPHE
jgi:hypothetical protein